MDANGTKFHTLLGYGDWSSCLDADGQPLRDGWEPSASTGNGVEWDASRYELTLQSFVTAFPSVKRQGKEGVTSKSRRGGGRDRYENWYWIDETEQAIDVQSCGTGSAGRFWPPKDTVAGESAEEAGAFHPTEDVTPQTFHFSGLAVTTHHYLVVGVLKPYQGLLVFDLHSNGPPMEIRWPESAGSFSPYDIVPDQHGGLWVLDQQKKLLWAFDRRMEVRRLGAPSVSPITDGAGAFTAVDEPTAEKKACVPTIRWSEADAITVEAGMPVALDVLADGSVLVLDRMPAVNAEWSAILWYGVKGERGTVSLEVIKHKIEPSLQIGFTLIGHDIAVVGSTGTTNQTRGTLFVAEQLGDQAYAFDVLVEGGILSLHPRAEFYPMRRFRGRGIVGVADRAYYDFDDSWLALVRQRKPAYQVEGEVYSPDGTPVTTSSASASRKPFDGRDPNCVWHRLMLDGCIPPETSVTVWSRAANRLDELRSTEWQEEPRPYRRTQGSELPFVDESENEHTGTWELLFQRAKGRFLQLRLQLKGNRRSSPRIRAVRAYYPRFSYLREYLPAVYRDDPGSASFLDRYLATVEGMYTAIEDRVASVHVLFDKESVPAEYVDWLAGWYGIVFDARLSQQARRLALKYAMTIFQYRGTPIGLEMALRLVMDQCPYESIFTDPFTQPRRQAHIRIVEKCFTRRLPAVIFGDPTDLQVVRAVPKQGIWKPSDGGDGLHTRYREALSPNPPAKFPISDPENAQSEAWRQFTRNTLGFVPRGGGDELWSWQQFLAAKYGDPGLLPGEYGLTATSFEQVALPQDLPNAAVVGQDWNEFLSRYAAQSMSERLQLWQQFLSRRYQRIQVLNTAYGTTWMEFDQIPFPCRLPSDGAPLQDWYQFEAVVLGMQRTAYRFSVLLPMPARDRFDPAAIRAKRELAERVIALEKPAHTVGDVKFYWALFRVGEARLAMDTLVELGSRSPDLMPPLILGHGALSEGRLTPVPLERITERQQLDYPTPPAGAERGTT